MEWIAIGTGTIINIIIVAYGYGKLTQKAEINKEKITTLTEDCFRFRSKCHDENLAVDNKLFEKIDELKEIVNQKFLELKIQVTEIKNDGKRII